MLVNSAGPTLPESTTIIEHLDRHGAAPPLIPADPDAALQARLWDRLMDGHVMTPMQRIVADALRPEGAKDPYGVEQARAQLDAACAYVDDHLETAHAWLAGPRSRSPTAPPRQPSTTHAWCTAGTRRHSPT